MAFRREHPGRRPASPERQWPPLPTPWKRCPRNHDRIAQSQHSKYGLCPRCRPTHSRPAEQLPRLRPRSTKETVRRDGVTARPTPSCRIIVANCVARGAGDRRMQPEPRRPPPMSTATSGRFKCSKRGRHSAAAAASRAGVTRCSAVQVADVGAVEFVVAVHHDEVNVAGSMRGCCAWTTGRPCLCRAAPTAAATPPQAITRSGNGGGRTASGTAFSGDGQTDAVTQRRHARGARIRGSGAGRQPRQGPSPAPAIRHSLR